MLSYSFITFVVIVQIILCKDIPDNRDENRITPSYYDWDSMVPVESQGQSKNFDTQAWYSLLISMLQAANSDNQNANPVTTKPATTPKLTTTAKSPLATTASAPINSASQCGVAKAKPLAPNCSVSLQSIVGGVLSAVRAWPWQVAFTVYDQAICGGTIISPNHILTAAHCTSKYTADLMGIIAGTNDLNSRNATRRKVSKLIQHQAYNAESVANDISILVLDKALTFNDNISPACLPTPTDNVVTGEGCYVTGWGDTQDSSIKNENELREVCLNIIDHQQCVNILGISDKVLCAGEMKGGKDSCQGDSGGPLVCKRGASWKIMGIVSWGVGCAKPNFPGAYTNVAKYRDWIKQQINI